MEEKKYFTVQYGPTLPDQPQTILTLLHERWNDWFEFETLFGLYFYDFDLFTWRRVGQVKIGQFDMSTDQKSPNLPSEFGSLDARFFSLGMDETYYETLKELELLSVLDRLNDLALKSDLFETARTQLVTSRSLLRHISVQTVTGQFRRIANGGLTRTVYKFSFQPPRNLPKFNFLVNPFIDPPSNIHVLIGRNGVGKTTYLRLMTKALVMSDPKFGFFLFDVQPNDYAASFANVVSVSFSAFDTFAPLTERVGRGAGVRYSYVGLKMPTDIFDVAFEEDEEEEILRDSPPASESIKPPVRLKDHAQLTKDFTDSIEVCRFGDKRLRWKAALEKLESDPVFKDAEITSLATMPVGEELTKHARYLFKRLSSGHQLVLLTTTRLVETVEERTLVLLDEPEGHLHPPLLSAFIRAISDLLVNRNAVAIIATHSPVVLQEVPKDCVSIISRSGKFVKIDSPRLETFGESVGILTHEVFGLEVSESGFHRLIKEKVKDSASYEEVSEAFNHKLGGEAKAIIQSMLAKKRRFLGS